MRDQPTLWTRRRLLGGLTGSWVAMQAAHAAAPAPAGMQSVSILHTTDLHGHIVPTENYQNIADLGGLARCATQIQRWRAECPDHVLVDLGDVIQGTPVSLATRGQLMMDLFKQLDYDAWVIGNHDLDWGRPVIEDVLARSASPVLTANLTVDGKATGDAGGPWTKVKPWMLKEIGGLRIALVGLTTPGMPMWLAPETLGGIAATDPIATLQEIMKEVRAAKPHAVVVLGHMGWKFQDDSDNPVRALLDQVDDIDVYLGGHSHQDQPSWKWKGVQCGQAGYHGIWCGRVDLHFSEATGKLVDARAFSVLMDDRIPADAGVMATAAAALAKADAESARVLRVLEKEIDGKGRGNALVQLMADAFSRALAAAGTPVDGVFHGSFNTGNVPAGPITTADVWKILPYENLLVTARLTRDDLLAIVAEDEANQRSDRGLLGFEIQRDADKKPVGLVFQGKPVEDATRRFTIAMNSYDAQSGGGRLPILHERVTQPAAKRTMTGIETRAALLDFLANP